MSNNANTIIDAPAEAHAIIAAGYRPDASTDLRAVQIAKLMGATKPFVFQTLTMSIPTTKQIQTTRNYISKKELAGTVIS